MCAFPDGETVSYEKIHPFSYSSEDASYEAGDTEETLFVDISPERVKEVRETYPFFRDRRGFSVRRGVTSRLWTHPK